MVGTRAEHRHNCRGITAFVSAALDLDLFDFACQWGLIQYIYAHEHAPDGLRLIKSPSSNLVLPENWLDQVSPFEQATEAQSELLTAEALGHRVELDEIHRSIGDTCRRHGFVWIEERHKNRTIISLHTGALKIDHEENKRRGVYNASTPATDKSKPNAFAFLLKDGGLAVRLFGGASEVEPWYAGPSGIQCCNYNVAPTYAVACAMAKGMKGKKGVVTFFNGNAICALSLLNLDAQVPEKLKDCRIDLKRSEGFITVTIHCGTLGTFEGWTFNYGMYVKQLEYNQPMDGLPVFDDRIRHTTELNTGVDWMLLDERGHWKEEPRNALERWIKGNGYDDGCVAAVIKYHLEENWLLQRIPFAPQYPGLRQWNRDGARLAVKPMPGEYPHTRMILDHCGAALTPYLDEWCVAQGMNTGGDYLFWWAARMFQKPASRLPMLFLYSAEQSTGKSALHKMLQLQFANSNGWCELAKELTKNDFNDALRGCVLAYIEEIDLSKNPVAYDLVKNLIDGTHLKMRGIWAAAEMIDNYVHLVQTANYLQYCGLRPGDLRTVVIPVHKYTGRDMPWKDELEGLLKKERAAFLYACLSLKMPEHGPTRVFLPVLETPEKRELMALRESEGWYGALKMFAFAGEIQGLEAKEILAMLVAENPNGNAPGSAGGLGAKLKSMADKQLARDGYILTFSGTPARYTIVPKQVQA